MSILNNSLLLGAPAAAGGYSISRSLRFNSSDSAYLSRTPASAGTSRTTWTLSFWYKRSNLGTNQCLFIASDFATTTTTAYITASDTIEFYDYQSGAYTTRLITTQVFRDSSAWYHLVFTWDTNNGTSTDRARIYVNGVRISAFGTSTYPNSGVQSRWNNNVSHVFGLENVSNPLNGYLADVHLVDGQALTPTSFGEFDATTGVWNPKAYTGTYGTNGFRLPFSDNSAATATTLGKDSAGSNNWTPNNFSVTAGAGNDSLVDSPTNGTASSGGDAGGTVVGNYCTLNPLFSSTTLTNGNLDAEGPSNAWHIGRGTFAFPTSDKWYWEATVTGTSSASYAISVATASAANSVADFTTGTGYYGVVNNTGSTINKVSNGTATTISTAAAWAQNDILMCAYDGATGKVWFGRNGTWYPPTSGGSAGNPGAGTNETMTASGTVFPAVHCYGTSGDMTANFGARPFAYAAPSGYKSLNTANLPTPTILKGSSYFDTKLYTGNGSTQTISGLGFGPEFVWIKGRSGATDHALYDAVRGTTKDLVSNSTAAETTQSTGLTAFNSDGFSLGALAKLNTSSATYAAWCWDAAGSDSTNTSGSITSTVRANASAGFSVVTWTGTGANATVGHGLGVTPGLVLVKNRDAVASWAVWTSALSGTQFLGLNTTNAAQTSSTYWNSTIPTSTLLYVGSDSSTNGSTNKMVAYCFAPVSGYSSAFTWSGTGSTDGPFVHLGFRAKFLIWKRTDFAANWVILDTARSSFNVADDWLGPHSSSAESSDNAAFAIDILSNGVKIRATHEATNQSGGTYVGFAFAENPFSIARAR